MWRRWWLLIKHYSYLPLPHRPYPLSELPQALPMLPLWGLWAGLLLAGAARLARILTSPWQAALLVGVMLLLNGGVWLRDLMAVADGRRPLTEGADGTEAPPEPELPIYAFGKTSVIVACFYLALQYLAILLILRGRYSLAVLPALSVAGRWFYLWGVYDFAARPPAFLKQGYTRHDFVWGSLLSVLCVTVCAYFAAAIWVALAAGLCAVLLFYRFRSYYLGALDECSYGAAAAWGEVILLWAYVGFAQLL